MKKITLCVLTLLFAIGLSAQTHFGIKGGLNYHRMKIKEVNLKTDNSTGWHAGVLLQAKLPFGLAFQPEVLYSVRSFEYYPLSLSGNKAPKLNFNYIEVPINIQWGIDLILLRPFVMASPYFSYLLSVNDKKNDWKGFNNVDYGLGLGAGLDLWMLQVTAKYNWGFGTLGNANSGDIKINDGTFKGLQLSVGILF